MLERLRRERMGILMATGNLALVIASEESKRGAKALNRYTLGA
jgi:hypothetical protein